MVPKARSSAGSPQTRAPIARYMSKSFGTATDGATSHGASAGQHWYPGPRTHREVGMEGAARGQHVEQRAALARVLAGERAAAEEPALARAARHLGDAAPEQEEHARVAVRARDAGASELERAVEQRGGQRRRDRTPSRCRSRCRVPPPSAVCSRYVPTVAPSLRSSTIRCWQEGSNSSSSRPVRSERFRPSPSSRLNTAKRSASAASSSAALRGEAQLVPSLREQQRRLPVERGCGGGQRPGTSGQHGGHPSSPSRRIARGSAYSTRRSPRRSARPAISTGSATKGRISCATGSPAGPTSRNRRVLAGRVADAQGRRDAAADAARRAVAVRLAVAGVHHAEVALGVDDLAAQARRAEVLRPRRVGAARRLATATSESGATSIIVCPAR